MIAVDATLATDLTTAMELQPATESGKPAKPAPVGARTWKAIVLFTFVVGALLRLPTFVRPLLSDDEAIYATTADALVRGDLLYRDVVDHKPPLVYHVYQAAFALFGQYETHGAHAFVVLSVLLTAAFLYAMKRLDRPVGVRAESLAAAALFLVFSTTWHDYDALAANCELFLLAPQTIAAWLLLRDLHSSSESRTRWVAHLGVGALVGVSALFKYQGITFLGASLGMLCWWALLGRISPVRVAVLAACQVVAAAVPTVLYLLGCRALGNLDAAIYWFRFNFSYVGAGLGGLGAATRGLYRLGIIGGTALVPYALGGLAAVATALAMIRVVGKLRAGNDPRDDLPPPSAVLGLFWLATSAVAVCAGGRFFGHYFHLVLAPLCLMASPPLCRLWRRGSAYRVSLAALCAVPAALFFLLATVGRPVAAAIDEGEPDYEKVAARIAAATAPDERIFVWGNSPQLYVLARRPMGTRFSFCNYMTGESPGTPTETGEWNPDTNQLPAAWDMLLGDLEQRRPSLLVDAAAAGWDGYDKFPLARYPRLRSYVDRHYRPLEVRAGAVLYRRVP